MAYFDNIGLRDAGTDITNWANERVKKKKQEDWATRTMEQYRAKPRQLAAAAPAEAPMPELPEQPPEMMDAGLGMGQADTPNPMMQPAPAPALPPGGEKIIQDRMLEEPAPEQAYGTDLPDDPEEEEGAQEAEEIMQILEGVKSGQADPKTFFDYLAERGKAKRSLEQKLAVKDIEKEMLNTKLENEIYKMQLRNAGLLDATEARGAHDDRNTDVRVGGNIKVAGIRGAATVEAAGKRGTKGSGKPVAQMTLPEAQAALEFHNAQVDSLRNEQGQAPTPSKRDRGGQIKLQQEGKLRSDLMKSHAGKVSELTERIIDLQNGAGDGGEEGEDFQLPPETPPPAPPPGRARAGGKVQGGTYGTGAEAQADLRAQRKAGKLKKGDQVVITVGGVQKTIRINE